MDPYVRDFTPMHIIDEVVDVAGLTKVLNENKKESFTVMENNIRSVWKNLLI